MGYYSDTTSRMLDQIGRPYKIEQKQGLDLSSLLMALMFMPNGLFGKTSPMRPTNPTALAGAPYPWPNMGPISVDPVSPEAYYSAFNDAFGPMLNKLLGLNSGGS